MQMYSMNRRLKNSNVTVTSLHPGLVSTEIGRAFDDRPCASCCWNFLLCCCMYFNKKMHLNIRYCVPCKRNNYLTSISSFPEGQKFRDVCMFPISLSALQILGRFSYLMLPREIKFTCNSNPSINIPLHFKNKT